MFSTTYLKSFLSSYLIKREGFIRDLYFDRLRPLYLGYEGRKEQKQWQLLGKSMLSDADVRTEIRRHLQERRPYTVAKIGGNELAMLQWYYGERISETKFADLHQVAGIFPNDRDYLSVFAKEFAESLKSLSLLGLWTGKGEPTIYSKAGMTAGITSLSAIAGDFESIAIGNGSDCWFSELRGYRVMVISSFAEQIHERANEGSWNAYWGGRLPWLAPREIIPAPFPYGFEPSTQAEFGSSGDLLDKFKLRYQQALENSDIVLAACGAHVIPLLDWAHRNGKVAIHMGANLQVLFGIKGGRWDERKGPLASLYNEHWVRPHRHLVPSSASKVEKSAYW